MTFVDPPTHALADFQVEYDGLLMGPGTPFGVPPQWEFLNLSAVKTLDTARIWGDGSYSGPDFSDVLTPTMPLEITATDEASFADAVNDLRLAFGPKDTPASLWFKLPGFPAEGIGAKVSSRTIPVDLTWGVLSVGSVQWRIPSHPVWQEPTQTVQLIGGNSILSGAWVANEGNTDCYPYAVVSGPCSAFTLTVNGTGIGYVAALASGKQLVLDFLTGQATIDSVLVNAGLTSQNWAPIPADSNVQVQFDADGGTCLFSYASMWR